MKKIILTLALSLIMVGCKTTEPLYYYGDYNAAVYSYLKGDETTLEEQISVIQETLQLAEAKGKRIAPGVHAHLGMLYFETGNVSEGEFHLQQEKQLFPESAKYIDFLLSSAKGA